MRYSIHIQPEAELDIETAASWYECQQKNLGHDFLQEISHALKILADDPFMYALVYKSTRRTLIRRFPFGIYYQIEEDSVVVVAVMHGSRNPKRWIKRT